MSDTQEQERTAWTHEEAIRAAHAAGFAGESWIMGPEELAVLLTRARPAVTLSDEQQPPEVADILSLAVWHGAQACNLPAVSVLPKHQHRETAEVLRQYARALLARASVPTEAKTKRCHWPDCPHGEECVHAAPQSAPDGGDARDGASSDETKEIERG